MATPPENRESAEPSPWSEWLARRDQQADQPQDADQYGDPYREPYVEPYAEQYGEPPAAPPLYDPEQFRRPAAPPQPVAQPAPQPDQPQFPGQPDPYQPQYYNRAAPQYPQQAPYADEPYQQYPPQYPEQQPYPGQQYPGQQYPPGYPPEQYLAPHDPYTPPGGRKRSQLPLVAGIAAVVVALAIGGAFLVHSLRGSGSTTVDAGGSTGPAPTGAVSPSASSASPGPSPSGSTPAEVSGATDVPPNEAAQQLKDVNITDTGDIRLAESWTDANGGNLLVASRIVDKKEGDRVVAATIKVWQVTHTDTDPKVVRTMTDPVSACQLDFDTDVDTAQGFVKDLDGDGIAEATVAWHISCRGDVGPALAKVALLSDGRKFILRGDGYPNGRPGNAGQGIPPATVKEVDPKASEWPDGFKDAATEVYLTLYS